MRIISLLLALCFLPMITHATPALTVTPSISNFTMPSGARSAITYTITNNLPGTIKTLQITPNIIGDSTGLSLDQETNQCTGALGAGQSCTFQVAVDTTNRSSNFLITPRVCVNNLNCVKAPDGSFTVNVANRLHDAYAYIGMRLNTSPTDSLYGYLVKVDATTFELVNSTNISLSQSGWAEGVAVSLDGSRTYVVSPAQSGPGTTYIVDTSTNIPSILESFEVGTTPTGIALTPDNSKVYVGNLDDGTLTVYNTQLQAIEAVIILPGSASKPYGMQITPDGSKLCVVDYANGQLDIYGVSDNNLLASIPINDGDSSPVDVAISPDGRWAYVSDAQSTNVYVVDMHTFTLSGSPITLETAPQGIAFSYDGLYAYVTGYGSAGEGNVVYAINTQTKSVTTSYVLPQENFGPLAVALDPQKNNMFVVSNKLPYLDVININTNTITSVTVGDDNVDSGTIGNFVG